MKTWFFGFLFLLAACQKPPSLFQFTGNAMTMNYRILIGHPLNEQAQQQVEDAILAVFEEVNGTFNKWNPHSELSALNQLEGGKKIPLSPQLEQFFYAVDQIVKMSGGKFDPTIETIQQLWKKDLTKAPQSTEVDRYKTYVGWHTIHFSNGFFWKDFTQTQLDLGGIAKGLCVDLLLKQLNSLGYSNAYVEWGGEIRASGEHPEKRPWRVFISSFGNLDPKDAIAIVDLHDQAIATSGDYLQNWTVETTTYFHIFNPLTGSPLESTAERVASASVRGASCAMADGLATTAMLFPDLKLAREWAQEMEKKDPTLTFWLKAKDGSSYITASGA